MLLASNTSSHSVACLNQSANCAIGSLAISWSSVNVLWPCNKCVKKRESYQVGLNPPQNICYHHSQTTHNISINFLNNMIWFIRGTLLDVDWRCSQNFQNLNFIQQHTPPKKPGKEFGLKSFHYEMKTIFTESLRHKTLFNTVVFGSNDIHNHA